MVSTPTPARPLLFGVFMQPVHAPDENPTLALERDLELLEHLDRLGFDEAWIGEHHSTGWETIASPAAFIATAAQRTRHIRLGSGVVPLPLHHPLVVAGEYALLDHLTRGRVMLGVGAGGGLPSDPLVFGLDPASQPRRFLQAFDALMRLLTETEPITLREEGFELRDAVLQLRSYTHPHIPIAVATGNPEALERVGRYGARWLVGAAPDRFEAAWGQVERGARAAGRLADRHDIALPITVHLADTREEALDAVRLGAAHERFDFSTPVTGSPLPTVARGAWAEHLAERPNVVIGTPEDAIAKIDALHESTGAGGVLLTTKEWANREATWRSYELFARRVMPVFQGSLVGLHAASTAAKGMVAQPA